MRRTEQEFKAEVFRRSATFRARRKRRIKAALASLGCLAVILWGVQLMPGGFGGSSAECADQSVECALGNQAPAAAEPREEVALEDGMYDQSGSACGGTAVTEITLEPEDYETMDAIVDSAEWTVEIHDCVTDVVIIRDSRVYGFSTGCGTLFEVSTGLTAELSEQALGQLCELIEKYQ